MNRRAFLNASLGAALLPAAFRQIASAHHMDRIGLQLYTVRANLEKDFDGTLAEISAIGYSDVEFANYFGKPAKEVRAILDRYQLSSPSSHVDYASIGNYLPQAIEMAHILGQTFLVCPWIDESLRKTADDWKRLADFFNLAGEATQKAEIQIAFHNHAYVFAPTSGLQSKLPYDFLLESTDPKLVQMEMDICWTVVGKQDPVAYFHRYPGRFPLVHAKDRSADGKMADVGIGAIDWKRIFAAADVAGIKHVFVENDDAPLPFEDIRISYNYLRQLRF
jgi:sugar phosphate isomerase/epimerase